MLLDATPIKEADTYRPAKFRLLGLKGLRDWVRGVGGWGSGRPWLAKLDLQNTFWSMYLPASGDASYSSSAQMGGGTGTRLLLGWRYSPVVCQTLVRQIVKGHCGASGPWYILTISLFVPTARDLVALGEEHHWPLAQGGLPHMQQK